MASPYEAIKVQNLIRTYKTNPTMFNDDQLDELERLAENNEIEFKRRQSEFSLRRGLQQAQAGFIEGLTTFDLIPKEPRNTGEAIFRQLGHLAGFAPAILKAPVMGVVQVASKVTGKEVADIAKQPFTSAVLDGINALDAIAVPMIGSRLTKKGFDAALTKTGAESLEFLKRGSRTRAITEEALGLASASAISNIWKGKDAIVDSYIGGAIAGGAFGGIGNFVSLGNLYKGTPQQVEQANKLLRAGVASMFMGLPSTLRNDPTEMQIYEYLLGGFFGYNTRPAKEVEAGKWINENRAREEIFRPETSKDWNKVNKNAQEFIIREHPMTKELNSEGHGGSTGAALGYLERRFPNAKWREGALNNLKKNNKEATESNIQDFYRKKAYEAYRIEKKVFENAVLANSSIINDERLDAMDQAQRDQFKIEDISDSISKSSDKYGDRKSVGETIIEVAENSSVNNVPNRELFIRELSNRFDSKTIKKLDSKLRGWFNNYSQRFVEQDIVNIDGQEYRIITKEKIGEVDVGEKVDVLPATYLVPEGEFRLMTHFIREVPSENGQVKQEAIKIMKTDLVFDYGVPTVKNRLDGNAYIRLQNLLEENGRYIVSGIKDKDYVMTGRFRDENLTLDNVFDILSNKQAGIITRKQVEDAYNRSLEKERELSEFVRAGEYEALEKLHERKWISNFVNLAEMNNLKLEDAWAIIDPAQNFGKSVADLNKRMSLVTNRMTPMVKESFENVAGMNKGEKFNVIQIEDNLGIGTGVSDTDGYMAFRHDIFDATTKSFGRDVKNTGQNKPVIAAKTPYGFFATKSNGQRAHESLNEWMMKNDVHAVIYTSGSKLKGNNPISTLKYEKGNYVSDNINRIEIPIDKLQVSSGTYENTKKDVRGASTPMQKFGQANEEQAFGFADKWIDTVVKPSLEGSERGRKILENYQKTNDLTEMSKAFENKDIKLEELPFRFVIDTLLKNPDSKLGRFLSDRLMRLEVEGELDKTVFEDSFSPDSDTAFREYHRTNDLLAEALRGSFVAKHAMPFNKKNYFNALRKFVLKRFANPHIETAGKSWLKGYTPEMLNFFDIDPYSTTQATIVKPDSANSINIMRGSKYGNPFVIPSVYDKSPSYYKNKGFIRAGSTKEAIERYESWLRGKTDKGYMPDKRDGILNDIRSGKLSGKSLGYFKPEAKDSHAVRLVKLINEWSPRTLKEGEIYLDNGFQQMPVVLLGKQYTLGEVWDMYTGRKTMPDGVKKPTKEEWNDAFTFLAIRTPADSMSGTRKLRFRGFTGQRGAGSITHHKDNKYLGGADKDGDSIKIFQNMNKDLIKYFENVKDERGHWADFLNVKKDFIVDLEGAEVEYYKNIVSTNYKQLDSEINWVRGGKSGKRPIFTQYYGDKNTEYSYTESGKRGDWTPLEWTPELIKLKREVERITGYKFNSAVVNKYKDGKDSIGFHRDNEPELMRSDNRGPVIASISFGSKRNFILKDNTGKKTSFALENGDLFLMKGDTQKNYTHGIAKENTTSPRINITFRRTNYGRRDPRKNPQPFRTKTKTYEEALDELFKGDVSQQVVDDFNKNKIMMFSPSFRFEVARNASMGKGGLGFGLTAKIDLQNMYDYVKAKGGSIKLKNSKGEVFTLEIKHNSPYEGVSAHRFFLDLGTKVVNVSADASNDPNLRPYSEYRDMLSSSIFKINNKDAKFGQIKNLVKGTPLEGIMMSNTNIKPHQKYLNEKTNEREAPDVFQVLDNINKANELMFSDLDDSFFVRTVNPKLNQLLQESGFKVGNYLFPELQRAHKILYDSFITSEVEGIPKNPDALYKWEVVDKKVTGRLIINNNKTSKQLEGFYKILAKELSFTSPNRMKNLLSEKSRNFNPDQALDFLGKDMGQYALMELLTGQYVAVQNAFAKQGRNVNTVIELLPEIKKNAYEIKRLADTISRRRDGGDNVRNVDLDALIYKHKTRLANLERAQGLEEGMLQNYLHYWLLSPIRALVKGQNKPQYYKAIHGSQMIPMSVKRNFYNRMDKIYKRAQSSDMLSIKQADFKTALNKLESTQKLSTTINEAIKSKSLENLALFESDLKEVRKFQESVKNNSLMDRDFNEWYTAFTKNMVDGPTKDATTITMQDIKLVNRYLDSLNTSKNMELKLAQFYQHPLTVDEIMQSKGLFGGYTKTINEPVLTSKGLTKRNVKVIMSPVGNIANYFKKSEAGINLYEGRMKLETTAIDKILNKLTPNQRRQYAEALFAYREGIDKDGKPYSLKNVPKEINMTKFKKLDTELTKFWKQMENSWITTKDINGKRFNWSRVDKEKRYGKVNEYIEYDSNGKFNFKKFHDKVINARNQSKDIIRNVGIEGVLRYRMEESIEKEILSDKSIKNKKAYREMRRSELSRPYQNRSYENYVHHSFNNASEGLLKEQAEYVASIKDPAERSRIARLLQTENPFINVNDILEISIEGKTKDFNKYAVYSEVLEKQGDIPYKRSFDSLQDYQTKAINGYFRNLMKLKAQNELDLMVKNTKDYKPSKHEQKEFEKLYRGSKLPKELRYNSHVDVWADYVRLYARDSLGNQSFLSDRMVTPQGKKLLHLNKKNLWYGTSDEAIINKMEKLYKSKLGEERNIPFFNKDAIPKDPVARKEYFSRVIHNLGRMEAQYELLTLLANTGTWTTNIFGGATMTIGSAGAKNYANSFNNKRVYDTLLSDANGNPVLKLLDGTSVRNRKQLLTFLEERGVIDNFIKNEFEYNDRLKIGLKKAGVSIKDFQRDLIKAAKSKKGNRDESVMEVVKRYGVTDLMLEAGGFLMKQSERVNRLNAFIAHGLQAVEGFKEAGKELSLADQYVFEKAERGIEMTQFLYQNAHRPAFMRTSMGKVLGRFKLFVFNSVRMRKEFYKQAKLNGFKQGSESYERFKDTFAIDMMMYALGSAFMFSLFDTTLPPPWDWVQALADYTFGDKREREMAFFGSKLGPLNVLKPPIARVPEAFGELLTGQYEDFTNYTAYTMFPFGRGIRQIKQLTDDRPFRGIERAPEILFRIPRTQVMSRIKRMQSENEKRRAIEELLN